MAVADYVEYQSFPEAEKFQKQSPPLPPTELTYALQALRYHTLPDEGGLRNQSVRLMLRMNICLNIYNALTGYYNSDMSTEWTSNNRKRWEIVCAIQELQSAKKKTNYKRVDHEQLARILDLANERDNELYSIFHKDME